MVRHHVKKKKVNTKSNVSLKVKKEKRLEEDLEDLDRFAGSSGEDEEDGSDGDDDASDDDASDDDGSHHETRGPDEKESPDSENSEDDYDDVYQENMASGKQVEPKQTKKPIKQKEDVDSEESEEDGSSENDYNDEDQSDDDEMMAPSPRDAKSQGMANAMSRILGGMMFQTPSSGDASGDAGSTSKAAAKPVILSKTTTPLQRLQQKIKTEEQALRAKRQNRRAENLSAMRLPLAPTAGMSAEKLWKQKKKKTKRKRGASNEDDEEVYRNENALAIANEIEGERAHRRIATRGVVALFNAISKHRAGVASEAAAKEEEKRRIREEGRQSRFKRKNDGEDGVSSKTKHGFLDMIKKSAVAAPQGNANDSGARASGTEESKENGSTKADGSKSAGWSALKDDFMMNSKLKDWDKDISDDDDEEPKPKPDEKAETGGERKKKRQKVWVS